MNLNNKYIEIYICYWFLIVLNKNWSIGLDDGGGWGIVDIFGPFPDVDGEWRIAKNLPSGVRMYEPRDPFIRWIRTPAGISSRSNGFNWTSKAKQEKIINIHFTRALNDTCHVMFTKI